MKQTQLLKSKLILWNVCVGVATVTKIRTTLAQEEPIQRDVTRLCSFILFALYLCASAKKGFVNVNDTHIQNQAWVPPSPKFLVKFQSYLTINKWGKAFCTIRECMMYMIHTTSWGLRFGDQRIYKRSCQNEPTQEQSDSSPIAWSLCSR